MNLTPKVLSLLQTGSNRVILVPKTPMLIRRGKEVAPAEPAVITSPQDVRDTLGGLATLANYHLILGSTRASEGTFSLSTTELGRLRINFIIQRGTPVVYVERIPLDIPSLNSIFSDPENLKNMLDILKFEAGIVLFTGTNVEFLSTAILSALKHINESEPKIIYTVEKPLRYLLNNDKSVVVQREVEVDVDSFPNGILQALYLKPDILYSSDIPDAPTLHSLVKLANREVLCIAQFPSLSPMLAIRALGQLYGDTEGFSQVLRELIQGVVSLSGEEVSVLVGRDNRESLLYGS